MEQLTYNAKIAVVKVLNEILNADSIVHENEVQYMYLQILLNQLFAC